MSEVPGTVSSRLAGVPATAGSRRPGTGEPGPWPPASMSRDATGASCWTSPPTSSLETTPFRGRSTSESVLVHDQNVPTPTARISPAIPGTRLRRDRFVNGTTYAMVRPCACCARIRRNMKAPLFGRADTEERGCATHRREVRSREGHDHPPPTVWQSRILFRRCACWTRRALGPDGPGPGSLPPEPATWVPSTACQRSSVPPVLLVLPGFPGLPDPNHSCASPC